MPARHAPGKIFAVLITAVCLDWICADLRRASELASKLGGTRAAAPPRLGINAHEVLILHHWHWIDVALAINTISGISFEAGCIIERGLSPQGGREQL